MSVDHQGTWILGLQGWVVARGGARLEAEILVLWVEHASGTGYRCSRCGEGVLFAYDPLAPRRIRDFPWAGRPCALEVTLARVQCPACHAIAVEATDWVEPYGRQTERYERYVAGLCSLMPATDVAKLEGLDKTTVYRLDKKWLGRRDARRPEHPVTRMGIDEIAIRKGHKYATVFYDLERPEVIGMTLTRKQRAVSRFFRRWGKEKCRAVQTVCMDLWAPYLNRWADGIPAFFTHRITNGISEGINNLIKVRKRRSYGFGDFRYFTLIILDATGALPPLDALNAPQL